MLLTEEKILSILESAYSGAVYDAMRELGLKGGILPSDIRPVDPDVSVVGKVWTCSGAMVEGTTQDESLLSWTGMLSAAPSGSVVVCQPNDSTIAHMGELSAETLKFRGVKGYVVDGGNRDTDFILKLGFPVFCRYLTPSDIVERWMVQTMGEPIHHRRCQNHDWRLHRRRPRRRGGNPLIRGIRRRKPRRRGDEYRERTPQHDPRRHGPAGSIPEISTLLEMTSSNS